MRTLLITLLSATALFGQAKGRTPVICDRTCLEGWANRYLDAMLAHDASKLPLARDYKFTENGQRLLLPDGLWNTVPAKGTFKVIVADMEAQSVGYFGSIQEMDRGAVIGFRLKIRNNQITEAEQFIQRSPSSAAGFERIGYKWLDPIPVVARATSAVASVPPAPGRFSTTNDWPHASLNFCANTRPSVSLPPPVANGTTTRVGLAGYSCACAATAVCMQMPATTT